MKTFILHFRHRQNLNGSNELHDVFEERSFKSLKEAKHHGKARAVEMGWWFLTATRKLEQQAFCETT